MMPCFSDSYIFFKTSISISGLPLSAQYGSNYPFFAKQRMTEYGLK